MTSSEVFSHYYNRQSLQLLRPSNSYIVSVYHVNSAIKKIKIIELDIHMLKI